MSEAEKYNLTAKQRRMLSDFHQHQRAANESNVISVRTIDSVQSLFMALNSCNEIKILAQLVLLLRSWLTEVSNFDPVSGHALHTDIIDFMDIVAKQMRNNDDHSEIKDRIYRIALHTNKSLVAIIAHTRDKILREHAMLPIHAVREVDSKSIQWLSRQPGRNLREKLSGKPYINAVRRRSSVDTAENRLLKAFLLRLEQILIERQNTLTNSAEETCEEYLVLLQRWLRSEDAEEIGAWGNLPPNNTLLQDKRYRKIWDGWLWLQCLDDQITGDSKRVHRDVLNVIYWKTISLLNQSGRFRTVQQPLGLDYDNFIISPELPVRGYLFPAFDSNIKGKIKFIKPDKSFGFITSDDGRDLYFNPYNLSRKLDINSLSAGNEVSFVIGSNQQGECADDITLTAGIIPVDFNLLGDQWEIQVGVDKYLLHIVSGNLVIEQAQGSKKKLKIESATLKDIPKTILSMVTDAQLEYSEPTNNQSDSTRMDSSVVDLCSIRPMFTNNTGTQAHLPFRFLQQIWKLKDGSLHVVDCGETKALNLYSDIETVSMRSLFSHGSTLSDATKSSASMFFTKKLRDYLEVDKLTYLVPDWGNDFDLEGIRKSVNFYFDESTPLPKSIAAIFAWQSSKKFVQDGVRENDFVLVVDSFDGGISITPIQAIYQNELDKLLPETQGMSWERHPTVIVSDGSIYTAMVRNLEGNGCQASKEILQLFGFDGLTSDAGQVSFVSDNNWYHLPGSIRNVLALDLDLNLVSTDVIRDCLNSTNRNCRGSNVYILPLDDTIRKPDSLTNYKWLDSAWSPIKGCQALNRWQVEVDDIVLWRDHLPELSIRIVHDGHFENFYLVKDATVTPQRGRTVNIPVEEFFTLPAGQTHYRFPLQQGEGNKELQFVAYLKSPAFPLKTATKCKLKMTYTYGADDPYELKFIPLNVAEASFKSIRVEWRSASDGNAVDIANLPVPDFPVRKTWSDFQKFPKEDGISFSDLLDWVERDMKRISDIVCYSRVSGTIPKWIDKENGNTFCFIDNVFIHKSSLCLNSELELPQPGDILSFYKIEGNHGKFSAEDVAIGNSQPTRCFLTSSLRFPALTIWNHGHSLSEPDVPEHFRSAILEGTQKILSIIESENMPGSLKDELFFFLCCMHKDAPGIVGAKLLDAVKGKRFLMKYHRNISIAIGCADLQWQQELLNEVLHLTKEESEELSSRGLKILGTCFWRSEYLIYKIDLDSFVQIIKKLYDSIKIKIISNDLIDNNKHLKPSVILRFELLLALLRTRGSEDEAFKTVLAPDKDLTKQYVNLVDSVSKIVIVDNIELRSRISLQIEKPEMFCKTPDLLYALRMYLTGDSGANTIIITGVSDED